MNKYYYHIATYDIYVISKIIILCSTTYGRYCTVAVAHGDDAMMPSKNNTTTPAKEYYIYLASFIPTVINHK